MKKSIPFELFGPNQYIMFDIQRLAELERALGRDITSIIETSMRNRLLFDSFANWNETAL